MEDDQLTALHEALSILQRMLAALDVNHGRLEVIDMIAPHVDSKVVQSLRGWEAYTLEAMGNIGLSISAIADGDADRLDLITSQIKEWEDSDG